MGAVAGCRGCHQRVEFTTHRQLGECKYQMCSWLVCPDCGTMNDALGSGYILGPGA